MATLTLGAQGQLVESGTAPAGEQSGSEKPVEAGGIGEHPILATVPRVAELESEASEAIDPPQPWYVARRPFWLALAATVVLSTLGGFAIYFIHKTTPATLQGSIGTSRDSAKSRPGTSAPAQPNPSTVARPASSIVQPQVGPSSASRVADPVAAGRPASSGALPPGLSSPPGLPSSSAAADKSSAPVQRATPTEAAAARNPAVAGAATSKPGDASLQWSGSKGSDPTGPAAARAGAAQTSPTQPAPGASAERTSRDGVGSFPPRPLAAGANARPGAQDVNGKAGTGTAPASTANKGEAGKALNGEGAGSASAAGTGRAAAEPAASALTPAVPQGAGRRDGQPGGRSQNDTASAATAPARPSNAPAGRLKAAQDSQCAESNIFSRFVCDERVRLRFCRDRWNEHQDCIVNHAPRDI